ncbi:hypothetical protein IGB42_02770 [Andreprevotia sp. IGB-42]|uniref:hypothetical protein n=1 Tax=Andreprevotia sp. IGB-42 TaxID=2497473 RepID=UPI00135B38E7|nr:hypothetical protein [Andreprevotia sp. IGB-42]KAF0812922.1 hypothetical protein IGB42_02770 [Andreprevotia sp. IGB-42]
MSRLWINHQAWLCRGHAQLASSGLRQSVPLLAQAPVDNTADTAVLRIQQLLTEAPRGSLRADTLALHIGAPWVRYAVIPWQDKLKRLSDWESYARVAMSQQYGIGTETWRVRVAEASWGKPRLVAAMEQGLYQTFVELARSQKLRLTQVEPMLTTAINRHKGALRQREFALLLIDGEQAVIAFWRDRAWRGVTALPVPPDALRRGEAVAALVRDAAVMASDFLPEQIYVVASETRFAKLESSEFDLQWLGPVHPLFVATEVQR